jgi:BirA family biotin operon repressor/biotin-[acetyl-CoA-carboxylase] ligase
MQIIYHERAVSTNTLALELADQGAQPGTVVWAGTQTGGRGQYDRKFASPPGGLYFSLLLAPELLPEALCRVTLAAGLGCALALEESCDVRVLLKWPNDLYCHGRKLGGILTEAIPVRQSGRPMVVVGVGMNINSRSGDFSPALAPRLTSVYELTGRHVPLEPLLRECCGTIERQVDGLVREPDKFLALWDRRDYCRGQLLSWESGAGLVTGIGRGILSDGRYCLEDLSGKRHAVLAGTLRPVSATVHG